MQQLSQCYIVGTTSLTHDNNSVYTVPVKTCPVRNTRPTIYPIKYTYSLSFLINL